MKYTKDSFRDKFIEKLTTMHVKSIADTTTAERYQTLSTLIRDYAGEKWLASEQHCRRHQEKQVYYLSIEFLLGRMLGMNLMSLGLYDLCREALRELGIDLADLEDAEEDPGLGNGGLGRLAACYLESMAAENLPGHGSCLRYRYGFFEQVIKDGAQVEVPDNWLAGGFPWEVRREDRTVRVKFGGTVHAVVNGRLSYRHDNYEEVLAVPYDIPIIGYRNDRVNTLRIWSAEPCTHGFVFPNSDIVDCLRTLEYKNTVEALTSVLYPDDSTSEGKTLRLKQHYFLVSASLQSILSHCLTFGLPLSALPEQVAIHINDTHPALAIPEFMRLLLDEHSLDWEEAWEITLGVFSYTNHTVLPEALEKWSFPLLQRHLPRLAIIINEINERFCRSLWVKYPGNWDKIKAMAILSYDTVHMAHLAIVGSHSVNGVAQIHTEILKTKVMNRFYHFTPEKFNNKTNGVAHRRWLLKMNPPLTDLLLEAIGSSWIDQPCDLLKVLPMIKDNAFLQQLSAAKRMNKTALTCLIDSQLGIKVDPDSIFDAHIKRIHGYKRQTLNLFHIMHLYNQLQNNPQLDIIPRTFIFAGKAAPGYQLAKLTIKLINTVAHLINNDPKISQRLKVVFLPNYNVSMAEIIIPATDVSEQIPTASQEACGTGNMKFMMNGSVTIGTLDGANIEIQNAVGASNIITFGLTAQEVMDYYAHGGYSAWELYHSDLRLKLILNQLVNGFLPAAGHEFKPLFDAFLQHNDQFFVLKDFAAYVNAQTELDQIYRTRRRWLSMCAHNIAHAGKFSGDRTFSEYAMDIWKLSPNEPPRCYCSLDDAFSQHRLGCLRSEEGNALTSHWARGL